MFWRPVTPNRIRTRARADQMSSDRGPPIAEFTPRPPLMPGGAPLTRNSSPSARVRCSLRSIDHNRGLPPRAYGRRYENSARAYDDFPAFPAFPPHLLEWSAEKHEKTIFH